MQRVASRTRGATKACVGQASRQRGEERAEEKEGADPRVDEVRVLAEPPEPGAAREVALEHGPGVHEGARARTNARLEREPAADRLEVRAGHDGVGDAPGVAGARPPQRRA